MARKRPDDTLPPTFLNARLPGGVCRSEDGSLWLYRRVPLGPVADAITPSATLQPGRPIMAALQALSTLTPARLNRRSMARGSYRQVHLLGLNLPTQWVPERDKSLSAFLASAFPDQVTHERLLLLGVRLIPGLGSGGFRSAVNSIADFLTTASTPMSDFAGDIRKVGQALTQAGLDTPSAADFQQADSWWSLGRSDAPLLPHADHMHVFGTQTAANEAQAHGLTEKDCPDWGTIAGHHTLTVASMAELDFGWDDASSREAQWALDAFDQGALAVSARFNVEPAAITRNELRRNAGKFRSDIAELQAANKAPRAEMLDKQNALNQMEAAYATGQAPPTAEDARVTVVFSGRTPFGDYDAEGLYGVARLHTMTGRQDTGLQEAMLCSPVRANPYRHDFPVSVLAYSGLPSLSAVGDEDGAILGFTERDAQPVRISPTAAAAADSLPLAISVGATRSGKTATLLWLALQFSRMRNPQTNARRPNIIFDPKFMSDHSDTVLAAGGQVASLDDMASGDGVMDPIRCAIDPNDGVGAAVSMLLTVNPWGAAVDETAVTKAVAYGVRNGATCTGQALQIARDHGQVPADLVQKVFDLAEATPLFRSVFGVNPTGQGLRVADGITLIKAGNAPLELPAPGQPPANQLQRVTVAVVRMAVFGSVMALAGRGGVLHLDEAWVFMIDPTEMDRLGRVAASQGVLPILYTQRVSDVVNAGLAGYISRGIILSITDPAEARAACTLFKLDPTPERLARIMAPATVGASKAPDPRSLKALVDPSTGRIVRGTVALHVDMFGRIAPVVVNLPAQFQRLASTTPDVVEARARERAAGVVPDLGFADGTLEDPRDHLIAPLGLYMTDRELGVVPGPLAPTQAPTAAVPATPAATSAAEDEWLVPAGPGHDDGW